MINAKRKKEKTKNRNLLVWQRADEHFGDFIKHFILTMKTFEGSIIVLLSDIVS